MFQSHDYCQVLSALIREHWSELNAFTTTAHFERNRVIFSVGDPPDAMFLIESEIVFNLLMVFCERIHNYQQQLASLAFDDVRGRLAREMLRLSELPEGEPKRRLFELPVRLTHQELADLVSTTRDNVTRIMNEFRKDGLVDYGRERIVVFPDRLEAYLRKRHT